MLLFFCQTCLGTFQGQESHIFQFAVATAAVLVEISGCKEPAVYNAHSGNAPRLHQVHEVPVTHTQLFCCFACSQHPVKMLQVIMEFIATEGHPHSSPYEPGLCFRAELPSINLYTSTLRHCEYSILESRAQGA